MPNSDETRVTVRLWGGQNEDLEALVDAGEYASRSQAIRAAVDMLVESHRDDDTPVSVRPCSGVADAD